MTRTASYGLSAAALAAIYGVSLLVVGSAMFAQAPAALGAGVTLDLTITATAAVYLLAVRPGHLKPWFLVAVFAGGLGAARLALPAAGRGALAVVGLGWAAIEVGLAATVIARLRRVARVTRARRREGLDLVPALEAALGEVLGMPRVAALLASDVSAVYYGLTGWFRRAPAGGFRVRRAWPAVAVAIAMLAVPESIGIHLLVGRWSSAAAWIATATSIYALLWVAGDAHALRLHPLRVVGRELVIAVGLRWRTRIPLDQIASVERIATAPAAAPGLLRAHVLWPDLLVTLRAPVTAHGPFGITRQVSRLTLSCDDAEGLLALF